MEDRWIEVIPENQGGGRAEKEPMAMYTNGQLTLNHAAAKLMGEPPKTRMQVNPGKASIRLFPSTPNDGRAFSISGGGNVQHRFTCRTLTKKWGETFVGKYIVTRMSGGIELRKVPT